MTRSPTVRTETTRDDAGPKGTGRAETAPTTWRGLLTLPLIVLAIAAGLAFAFYAAPSLLLLFAGILFAALLDSCTRGLGRILPLARPWRYAIVVLIFASVAVLGFAWGIVRLPAQAHALLAVMDSQLDVLER